MANDVIFEVELAARSIARLDVRISRSPLREAWDVRASLKAAASLSAIDGKPVREADVVGMMMGVLLPVQSSYLGAGTALAWWQRCIRRSDLSKQTRLLIGAEASSSRKAKEAQAECDLEDDLPLRARRLVSTFSYGDVEGDRWAEEGRRRALETMRANGVGLLSVALGLKDALSLDRDPERHGRVHDLKAVLERQAAERLERDLREVDEDLAQARRNDLHDMLESLDWEAPRGLGEAHMAVPDRIMEMGAASRRLPVLTGATKRIAFESKGDERALCGFLRTLTREAQAGEALLSAMEEIVARWASNPALSFDRRSSLPDVLWAMLALPVVDVDWIETACGLDARVVQKFIRRLSDAGAVEPWGERMAEGFMGKGGSVRLWVPVGLEQALVRHETRNAAGASAPRPMTFVSTLERTVSRIHEDRLAEPVSEMFVRFDKQIADIDAAFGHIWSKAGRR